MTEWTTLAEAHEALRTVVRGVPEADWSRATPCADWNVTQVLQHAAGDQLGYAAFITGGQGPEENPFAPSGTLKESPETVVDNAIQAAADAWATVDEDATEVSVPMPPNTMTAEIGSGACALDAAVHAWDIAVATGQPSPLTSDLAGKLLPVARATVEVVRGFAFAPELPAESGESGDNNVAILLRYLGRDPHWKP